ncbi:DUF202 domain-containing protein [Pseudonocardia sp. NPDC049635]|uniref:DUF202 domain-containing protein n=1 Tax=Pseudonocardia sp. NPDC049635 TaxID=3155506 RepID=UPI0033C64A1D
MADPGLQLERTALAWRRTGLAVLVGGVVGARLLLPEVGPAAWGLGFFATTMGMVVVFAAGPRLRRAERVVRGVPAATGPGGGLVAALAATCALAGGVALAVVLG